MIVGYLKQRQSLSLINSAIVADAHEICFHIWTTKKQRCASNKLFLLSWGEIACEHLGPALKVACQVLSHFTPPSVPSLHRPPGGEVRERIQRWGAIPDPLLSLWCPEALSQGEVLLRASGRSITRLQIHFNLPDTSKLTHWALWRPVSEQEVWKGLIKFLKHYEEVTVTPNHSTKVSLS